MEKDGSDDLGVESFLPTPPEDVAPVATPITDQHDAPKNHRKGERQSQQMGDEKFAALIAALHITGGNEVEFEAAINAAQKLDKLEDRSHLAELYKLLKETDDFFVRENVGLAIANMDGLKALPELLIAIRADGHDYDGLVSRLMWIVEDNSTESVPLLLDMLDNGTPQDRRDAAWLLGCVSERITPEPLVVLLDSQDEKLRENAVGSLGSFSDRPEVFALLKRLAVEDPNKQVRRSAVASLGYSGNPAALSVIEAAADDPSDYVSDMAKWQLERLHQQK